MKLPTLDDVDVSGKRVLLRADLNVSFEADGSIADDFRIRASAPTIQALRGKSASVILLSHLGRPAGKPQPSLSLRPIAERLSGVLDTQVQFLPCSSGPEAEAAAARAAPGKVFLLENLRFDPREEVNDRQFAGELARLGDIFVNDAFGVSHRAHASVVGLAKLLPHAAGHLLVKEIKMLTKLRDQPQRPFVVVMGGVKVSTKLPFIRHFLHFADGILLGGALANTILKAAGLAVGRSIVEEGMVEEVRGLNLTDRKLHLPIDVVVSKDSKGLAPTRIAAAGKVGDDEMILDVGPYTLKLFSRIIERAGTIIWNGPLGLFEVPAFARGTEIIAKAMVGAPGFTVVGGGDVTVIVAKLGLADKIDYISSGGGAMLEFLIGWDLPGVQALLE